MEMIDSLKNSMNASGMKSKNLFFSFYSEAVIQTCSVKKVFLEISQNSLENTRARVSLITKLQKQ